MRSVLLLILFASYTAFADVEKPWIITGEETHIDSCLGNDIFQAIRTKNKDCLVKSLQVMDVNESDIHGDSPLHAAIRSKNSAAILHLLRAGADLHLINAHGETPRNLAENLGFKQLAEYLENLELETKRLARAVDENDLAAANAALLRGASLGTRDIRLDSLLHKAAQSGLTEMGKLLLKAGAKVDARNYLGETPLHTAALRDDSAFMALLLGAGANSNALNFRRETPLDIAGYRGNSKTLALLKEFHATHGSRADVEFDLTGGDGQLPVDDKK